MFHASLTGLDKKKLRRWLALFFVALAVPTAILVYQAYSELKWEAFHQHRVLAEELAARIGSRFTRLIDEEQARPFADYAFLNVAGDPSANFLQRSPLSAYPVKSALPGLIGYFQVDTQGGFTTPLLPLPVTESTAYGIPQEEQRQRLALQGRIQQILSENRLVRSREADLAGGKDPLADARRHRDESGELETAATRLDGDRDGDREESRPQKDLAASAPVEAPAANIEEQVLAQAAFDRLNPARGLQEAEKKRKASPTLGRVEDLKLDYRYQTESADEISRQAIPGTTSVLAKSVRKERSALPEPRASVVEEESEASALTAPGIRIRTFESEIDAFEFSLLDSGHFVLFRKVWRDGQRYIQGALIEPQPFFEEMIRSAFLETALSKMSDLIVAYRGDVFSVFSGQPSRDYLSNTAELSGALLYQTRLPDPLGELELIFSINRLPPGAGSTLINWLAAILLVVLCGGLYLMYRLGARQIELARQQQDFVSAVSHELKTPLTSIRMYGEILREGWASEEKKKRYYDFIFDESERLSRLIGNVLQLARLTRNRVESDLKPVAVAELVDGFRPKVSSQIERAGFELNLNCGGEAGHRAIHINADHFAQIIINLVDNALKFAARAERKVIDIDCALPGEGTVRFAVRDYGPGVPKEQMKKIFRLFYRSENELTRETVGTGIGLALVHQLAQRMEGQVDVVNREPGAEFRVSFSSFKP